jgi:hypothetical protein
MRKNAAGFENMITMMNAGPTTTMQEAVEQWMAGTQEVF